MAHSKSMKRMHDMREESLQMGADSRFTKQHAKGKQDARTRIDVLTDRGSFVENQAFAMSDSSDFGMQGKRVYGDGVITGSGSIDGKRVWIASQDFSVLGGSLGEQHARKIAHAQEQALKTGSPFIQMNDSGGARIQEGVASLEGYGAIFRNNVLSSGVIPQISLILGPCAGGAAYSPAITDFVFMVDKLSSMFVTGPQVIKTVTGEDIDAESLGGALAHNKTSGCAHFYCKDEQECFDTLKKLLSFIPRSNREKPPRTGLEQLSDSINRGTPELLRIIPEQGSKPYDIREVISSLVDDGDYLEVHKLFAQSLVVCFARMGGRTVGIIANQPIVFAGSLDKDAADKGARFVRFCDAFGIPLLSLVDVPGYLPGIVQEHGGVIRHGAKLLYAIAEATVPKVALILRKAYGGAYITMASRALGYDRIIALPMAEVAVMGAEGAAHIIFAREIAAAEDPNAMRKLKMDEYTNTFMSPYKAATLGYIDDVIEPKAARKVLIQSFELLEDKTELRPSKKHGNIPL